MATPEDTLNLAEGEKYTDVRSILLHDSCLNDKSRVTNIFNGTKILIKLKAQINVSNLAKLRTCVQSKYFHTEETALKAFIELGLETFQIKVVCAIFSEEEGLFIPLQSTSAPELITSNKICH